MSKPQNRNRGKMLSSAGTDFIRKVDVYPQQLLDGDIKLVCQYDISPSSFPNTRLELISNTYQLYRFSKVKITYSSLLPTAINGLFIGYIDTDPSDTSVLSSVQTSNDVLRIARSHQGSVQGKIRDNWHVTMPIRDDDQFFFIGDSESDDADRRFKKMGTLYIYQVGQATKFDGTPLAEELSAGALNIEWSCQFMNPQLQSLVRVYDGVTEKDVYRVINNMSWYRALSANVTSANKFQDTRFRHITWNLDNALFAPTGVGNYVVCSIPIKFTIHDGVKSVNSVSMPYSTYEGTPYGKSLYHAVADGLVSLKEVSNFLQTAFRFAKGGIEAAKEIYDVISLVSSAFVYNLGDVVATTDVDDPEDADIDHSDECIPLGQCIVHYDGINSPIVEDWIEYQDPTRAGQANYDFTLKKLFIAFKIKRTPNDKSADGIIEPNLPSFPKIDNT